MISTTIQMNRSQIEALRAIIKVEAMTRISGGIIKAVEKAKDKEGFLLLAMHGVMVSADSWMDLEKPMILAIGYDSVVEEKDYQVLFPTVDMGVYKGLIAKGSYNIALEHEESKDMAPIKLISKHRAELLEKFDTADEADPLDTNFHWTPPPGTLLN